MVLANKSIAKIDWSLGPSISIESILFRSWSFTKSGSDNDELLASISNDGPAMISTNLYEVDIEKPTTLVLKNVNASYNGTYELTLLAPGSSVSEVVVFIAGKLYRTRNVIIQRNFDLSVNLPAGSICLKNDQTTVLNDINRALRNFFKEFS